MAEVNASLLCGEVIEGLANHGVHTPLPAGEAVFEGRSRKVGKLVFEDIERSPDVASISSRCGRRLSRCLRVRDCRRRIYLGTGAWTTVVGTLSLEAA